MESLQVARAALIYFREVISARESRHKRNRSTLALPLVLPSHHWIRGEDSEDGSSEEVADLNSDE